MKKTILVLIAIVFATNIYAQEMTKEKTLTYIKNLFEANFRFVTGHTIVGGTKITSLTTNNNNNDILKIELRDANIYIKGIKCQNQKSRLL